MHKLFSLSFRRIANRLNQQDLNALNVPQALQNSKIRPCGEGFLYRLPREEFKHIANIPCPINNLQDTSSQIIIAASKVIRHNAKIDEEKTCAKCPFKAACQFAKLPFTGTIDNSPKDFLIFLSGLSNLYQPELIYFRQWVSAYKLGDSIIAALNDLSEQGKEIEQYQRLRIQKLQQHKNIMIKKSLQKQEKGESQSIDEKFKLIQNLTEHPNSKPFEKAQKTNTNLSNQSSAFSFDDVEQFQPKPKSTKRLPQQKTKPLSSQPLKNTIGYQSIEKRQDMDSKPYQNSKPKKFEKGQYSQIVNELDYQMKTPKIKERKQPNLDKFGRYSTPQNSSKFQNKKYSSNAANVNYDNRKSSNIDYKKPYPNNRDNSFQGKSQNFTNNQYKRNEFNRNQRQFVENQYDQRTSSKNYQKPYPNNRDNNFQERRENFSNNQYKRNEFNRNQREFVETQYDQRTTSKNNQRYQPQNNQFNRNQREFVDTQYDERKKSKNSQNYEPKNYQRQNYNNRESQKYQNDENYDQRSKVNTQTAKQSPRQAPEQLLRNIDQPKQKANSQTTTTRVAESERIQQKAESEKRHGRNIRRRSRSTSGNSQTE